MTDVTEIQLNTKQAPPGRTHPGDAGLTGKFNDVIDDAVPEKYRGSDQDKHDMIVHGNRPETRRKFKLLTMTGFASMVVCAWEGLLPLFNYVLIDGGTALMFWGFIAVAISMSMVYLSIAEMAYMYIVLGYQGDQIQSLTSYPTGRQQLLDNTHGSPSLDRPNISGS